MLVQTVAQLIAELNTITAGMDQTNVPIMGEDNQLGLKVWIKNNSVKIIPALQPGEHIGS